MIGFKERTWRITLYRRELQPDGRVVDVEIETFDQVRPALPSGDIRDSHGRLQFLTAQGKEVLTGGIAFVAKELSHEPQSPLPSLERWLRRPWCF
jgi:hypothetical protein